MANSALNNDKLIQANKCIEDAKKLINNWSLLKSKDERYDDAIPLCITAANIYKNNKLWQQAIDAQLLIAHIYKERKETIEEVKILKNIAKIYKDIDTDKAIEYFTKIVEKTDATKNASFVSATWREIGDILNTKDPDRYIDRVIEAYSNSAKMDEAEYKFYTANCTLLKVTQICLKAHKYKFATNIFDRIIKNCVSNDSSSSGRVKWSIKSYIFNAILCSIIAEDVKIADSKLAQYKDLCPGFTYSDDDRFLTNIIYSITTSNELEFKQNILERDKCREFDETTSWLLLEIAEKYIDSNCKSTV
jgi:tetratricopeptide (TPR) repeat protein